MLIWSHSLRGVKHQKPISLSLKAALQASPAESKIESVAIRFIVSAWLF